VLIVECDNDPLIPAPMRAALRAGHPRARVAVVEGGGHYPYLLRPEAYNAAVGGFLGL
jgi:pimeloyl-ACP methyl ester carboxylesterase